MRKCAAHALCELLRVIQHGGSYRCTREIEQSKIAVILTGHLFELRCARFLTDV